MNFASRFPFYIVLLGLAALTGCGKKKFKPKKLKPIKLERAQYVEKQGDLEFRAKQLKPSELKYCFRGAVRKKLSQFKIVQTTIINSGDGLYTVDKKKTETKDLLLEEIYPQVKYKWPDYIFPWVMGTTLSTALSAAIFSLTTHITWVEAGAFFGFFGFTNLLTIPYAKAKTNKNLYKELKHKIFTSESIVKPKEVFNALLFFPLSQPLSFSVGFKNRKVENDHVLFNVKIEKDETLK